MFLDAGYEVIVVTKIFSLRTEIESDGVRIIDVPFSRASLNPFRELGIIWQLRRIYAREKPDIVYHVAFKPVLYGSLAAIWKNIPLRVNAIAGMGQLFLSNTLKVRFIRWFVTFVLWLLFKDRRNILIAQNKVDRRILSKRLGLTPEQSHLVRGVGVDLHEFGPNPKTDLKRGSDPLKGDSNPSLEPTPAQGLTPFSGPIKQERQKTGTVPLADPNPNPLEQASGAGLSPFSNPTEQATSKTGSAPLEDNPVTKNNSLSETGLTPFSDPNKPAHSKTGSDALKGNPVPQQNPLPQQGLTPFSNPDKIPTPPIITLVSRLIAEKGIHELIAASRILKSKNIACHIWLVGDPDSGSPHHISVQQLRDWESDGLIEWKGHTDAINEIYAQTDIAVLPSYSEGLPKSLLEACACGLPIVTTDTSGCLEVVEHNVNGFIVPAKDSTALAAALEQLVKDATLRDRLGREGRHKAETEFSSEIIIDQIKSICRL